MSRTPTVAADVLLAATLYLMTRYQAGRCPCIAGAVVQHLDLLSRQPDDRVSGALRMVCAQLERDWRSLAAGDERAAAAPFAGQRH